MQWQSAEAKQEIPHCDLLQKAKSMSEPAPSVLPTSAHAGEAGALWSFAEDSDLQKSRWYLNRKKLASRMLGSKVV